MVNKLQKIFGSTGPTGSISVFGSKKDGSLIYTDDVEYIQSLPAWVNGMKGALIDDTKPTLQDLNAILYTLSYQNAYSQQSGIPAYHASEEYFIGCIVSYSSVGNNSHGGVYTLFISKTDNNIGNALTDEDHWQVYHSNYVKSIGASLSYVVTNTDWFLIWEIAAAESGSSIVLPDPTKNKGREIWILIKISPPYNILLTVTGGSTVLMQDTDGFVLIPPAISSNVLFYDPSLRLLCTGVKWISTKYSRT